MRWFPVIISCVGCIDLIPEPPIADFEVICADQACEVAVAKALLVEEATYRWSIGEQVAGEGPELEVALDSGELERVTLEVETNAGTDRFTQFLVHTEAMGEGATGEPIGLAHGYIVIGDRWVGSVVTVCPDKRLVTSFIGGCFTGLDALQVNLSDPADAPPPYGGSWGVAATFEPVGTTVTNGAWEGARANVGGVISAMPSDLNWPFTSTNTSFEAVVIPTVVPRWMVVTGGGFVHKEATSVSCDEGAVTVGKGSLGRLDQAGWLGRL